jgi:hypothetical protein
MADLPAVGSNEPGGVAPWSCMNCGHELLNRSAIADRLNVLRAAAGPN